MSFGTDIDSLRAHSALSEPSGNLLDAVPYEPLNNAILIIWQQRNFRRENKPDAFRPLTIDNQPERFDDPQGIISDEVYERMKPALRLASSFHNLSLNFFVKIYHANIIHVQGTPVLADDYECKETDVPVYWSMMQSLSQKMRIYTGFRTGVPQAHAKGSSAISTLNQIPQYETLNSAYIDWYSRQDYDSQDAQKKNMIAFDLAATLVHEHAHKVWQVRNYTETMIRYETIKRQSGSLEEAFARAPAKEPLHSLRDEGFELGWSWERHFFGGLFPISNTAEGTLSDQAMTGNSWMAWNDLWGNAEPTMWVVAARTYNAYFNRLAWDAEEAQARQMQGTGATQIGGDDIARPLALYLTPLKVIKSWPVTSTGYAEFYKKHLDAIAQGLHVNTVYHS